MKKMILPALCLSLCLTTVSVSALNTTNSVIVAFSDDRQVIKSEELPEAVRKTLSTDDYKGWTVKEAAVVNAEDKTVSHYEVILTNEKETKTVKFHQDGTLVK